MKELTLDELNLVYDSITQAPDDFRELYEDFVLGADLFNLFKLKDCSHRDIAELHHAVTVKYYESKN